MFGLEGLFDFDKNGKLDGFERATMHDFLWEEEKKSGKKRRGFHDEWDDDGDDGDPEDD